MRRLTFACLGISAMASLSACATLPAPAGPTPAGHSLDAFESALAAQDSATAALAGWCAQHGIADPAQIAAIHAENVLSQPDDESARSLLEVAEHDPLGYRHVLLVCGDVVLSDAHNWYVPGRLTPAMNEVLETTNTPFGRVVMPLGFTRERLSERRGANGMCPANTILSHMAVLRLPDGKPISMVVECYTPANLAGSADK